MRWGLNNIQNFIYKTIFYTFSFYIGGMSDKRVQRGWGLLEWVVVVLGLLFLGEVLLFGKFRGG